MNEQQQRKSIARKNFLLTKINHVLPSSIALKKKCTSQYTYLARNLLTQISTGD